MGKPQGGDKKSITVARLKAARALQRVVEDFPEHRDGLDFREAAELLASRRQLPKARFAEKPLRPSGFNIPASIPIRARK
jgi:hypothetical protein